MIEIIRFSISSLFWMSLWFFGLVVLISFCLRWWPGDQLRNVRLLNYIMPWLLIGLVPALIIAGLSGRNRLAATLFAPIILIILNFLPLFLNCKKDVNFNGRPLKVMSYNVWQENRNISAVAEVIKKEHPDILLLQEINKGRIQILIEELKTLYSDGKPHLAYAPQMLQAVVSRYPMTPLEASLHKGRAQEVRLATPFGPITVINIHAYKFGWLRRHQQMTALLGEDVATAKNPVILGGDFNTSDQSQTYRLVDRYLKNAHWDAGCGFGFTFPSSSSRLKRKFSIPPLIRIDHIFYSSQFIPRNARTLNKSGGSDHLPVVAEFIINGSSISKSKM